MPTIAVTVGVDNDVFGFTPLLPSTSFASFIYTGLPTIRLDPKQVIGLIPLESCAVSDCRQTCEDFFRNKVFGKAGEDEITYENDWSTFLVDVSLYKTLLLSNINVTMTLERSNCPEYCYILDEDGNYILDEQGQKILLEDCPTYEPITLNTNDYGIFYDIESIITHPTYIGYAINWGKVVSAFGECCYKIKLNITATMLDEQIFYGCLESKWFELANWDCFRADGTVRFETWITGKIGDPYEDYYLHDLCGILWYDSIRLKGFLGYQKSPTYLTNNLEWGDPKHGLIEKVSDEQIQRWEWKSMFLPEYIHTRFSTFAMMVDKLFVSDYNLNNSDYTIKRKNIVYDSSYEPEYEDQDAYWTKRDKSKVNVFYKRGVQSVIKTLCCPTTGV